MFHILPDGSPTIGERCERRLRSHDRRNMPAVQQNQNIDADESCLLDKESFDSIIPADIAATHAKVG